MSKNKHTVKARKQIASLSPAERAVECAKNADRQAIHQAMTLLRESRSWKHASPEKQHVMEESKQNVLMAKRYVKVLCRNSAMLTRFCRDHAGRSAMKVANAWGFDDETSESSDDPEIKQEGEDEQHPEALVSSNSPHERGNNLQDEPRIPSAQENNHDHVDRPENGLQDEVKATVPSVDMAASAKKYAKLLKTHGAIQPALRHRLEWQYWFTLWTEAVERFMQKVKKIDSDNIVAQYVSPSDFFDEVDHAVWRTLIHDPANHDNQDWVTLPGPVSWWEGYEFEEKTESEIVIQARKTALSFFKKKQYPEGFENMLWSSKELMVFPIAMDEYLNRF